METLKLAQLREELEVRGLPKGGNKSELCQRLSEALEKDGVEVQEFLQGLDVRQDSGVNQGHKVGECTEEPREEEGHLNLGDSASVIGMQSVASGRSQRSRASSTGSRRVLLAVSRARLAAQLRVMKEINAIEREEAALKSKREMEIKSIEREEAALKSKREMLGLEAEFAGLEAEEKVLKDLKEKNKEITHIPTIREHTNPDVSGSERPMHLNTKTPEIGLSGCCCSGGNDQRDLSNKEVILQP
ncbi:uncharacterized protein [Palaemon carinicauda]|uniref:uncharacterized protein n=1 Tax=Palaemon carinicauda TaxID=392227 RepID=UPI0035B5941A